MHSLCFVLAALAIAAPKDPQEALLKKGVELRKRGKDAEALKVFREAYAKSKTPRALAQIALAEQALAAWLDADAHLGEALAAKTDPWIRDHRATLEGALVKIRDHIGAISVRANVAGARVLIGGVERGTLPLAEAIRFAEGPVTLRIEAEGHRPYETEVNVRGRTEHAIEARLEPLIEERAAVAQPPSPPPVPVASAASPPARTSLAPFVYLAFGGAAVGAGAGVVFMIVRAGHVDRYNDNSLCLPPNGLTREQNCGDARESAESAQTLSAIGFVAGGVLAAAGATLWVLDDGDERVAIGPGPGELGATLSLQLEL